MRISAVVGARPNFMKMAAILDEIRRRPRVTARLIHTGQHYSPEMSATFFDDLGMPEPDVNLEVGSGSHTSQTAAIMLKLEADFLAHPPDLVLVVGDVNSTMAAALVAAKLGIRVAHVEAGLRSFDRSMPEEVNRIVTDVLSDYLFASEASAIRNLAAEGVPSSKVFFVGNVMIDTLLKFRAKAGETSVLEHLGVQKQQYCVATLHRPSNVDETPKLDSLIRALADVSRRLPVVFPIHPRTRERLRQAGIATDSLLLTAPLGYLAFLRLISEARLVLTDSGGIQEETTILNVPCLTLRENTERPVTIECGTNRLVGVDPEKISAAVLSVLQTAPSQGRAPELWDGSASARILDVLEQKLGSAAPA